MAQAACPCERRTSLPRATRWMQVAATNARRLLRRRRTPRLSAVATETAVAQDVVEGLGAVAIVVAAPHKRIAPADGGTGEVQQGSCLPSYKKSISRATIMICSKPVGTGRRCVLVYSPATWMLSSRTNPAISAGCMPLSQELYLM